LWPPLGQPIICSVTRDTWISSVGKEIIGSNGGAQRLIVKGQQEYSILDIDPTVLNELTLKFDFNSKTDIAFCA